MTAARFLKSIPSRLSSVLYPEVAVLTSGDTIFLISLVRLPFLLWLCALFILGSGVALLSFWVLGVWFLILGSLLIAKCFALLIRRDDDIVDALIELAFRDLSSLVTYLVELLDDLDSRVDRELRIQDTAPNAKLLEEKLLGVRAPTYPLDCLTLSRYDRSMSATKMSDFPLIS